MHDYQVLIGEDELRVDVRAGSPTVLLLHGLAGHRGEWGRVIDRLDREVGIIAPDQRAHGASWALGTREVDQRRYVADAIALVERFATEPVVVVGQSMGGIVATLMAHTRPDLVARLVLLEAGMAAMTEADLSSLRGWFDSWPEAFADTTEAEIFFGADARSTPAWVNGLEKSSADLTRRFDANAMIETMRELASDDRWSAWANLGVPTIVVRASESAIADADIEQMMQMRPDTETIVIEDSGHDVHLDQPEQVAEILTRLFRMRD